MKFSTSRDVSVFLPDMFSAEGVKQTVQHLAIEGNKSLLCLFFCSPCIRKQYCTELLQLMDKLLAEFCHRGAPWQGMKKEEEEEKKSKRKLN